MHYFLIRFILLSVPKATIPSAKKASVGGAETDTGSAEIVALPARVSDVKLSPLPDAIEAPPFEILALIIGRIRSADKASSKLKPLNPKVNSKSFSAAPKPLGPRNSPPTLIETKDPLAPLKTLKFELLAVKSVPLTVKPEKLLSESAVILSNAVTSEISTRNEKRRSEIVVGSGVTPETSEKVADSTTPSMLKMIALSAEVQASTAMTAAK